MKKSERGMVRYAPYQSLVEQSAYLAAMRQQKAKCDRKILFSDEADEINQILLDPHGEVVLSYWDNGIIRFEEGCIRKIIPEESVLLINENRVPLKHLQSLKRK